MSTGRFAKKAGVVVEAEINKRLKIQIGVCKRMLKEVASYEKEVTKNEERVQKLRDEGKDSFDVKKQEEVLQESYMMVPDSKGRLEKTIVTLADIMSEAIEDPDVDSALLSEAQTIVDQNS